MRTLTESEYASLVALARFGYHALLGDRDPKYLADELGLTSYGIDGTFMTPLAKLPEDL
jgi:hypothetical protein